MKSLIKIAAALFQRGLAAKTEGLRNGYLTHSFWDAILFNKIKNVLGGRVRLMVSGSAPISAEVLNLLRACFSCEVLEGFGLNLYLSRTNRNCCCCFCQFYRGLPGWWKYWAGRSMHGNQTC